jgi:thiol-disulfide isomerase/thioredoxin
MSEPEPMSTELPAPPSRGAFLAGLVRDWGISIAVVLVLVAGYNFFFGARPPPLGPAHDFTLSDLDGRPVALSSLAGADDLVVLNFWFTNCPPCRAEIPELSRWHAEHPDVPLVGISTDVGMPIGRLRAESGRLGITYPVLHDVQADVTRKYGVQVFPTTLVLRNGEVVRARVGALNGKTLDTLLEAAREAPEGTEAPKLGPL